METQLVKDGDWMNFLKVRAHGKINLGLDIIRKREDGYHEVKMIMQTVGIYDNIEMHREKSDEAQIEIRSNLKYLPTNEGNLAYRAADIIMKKYNIKDHLKINVNKMIPVAAGMAGGSADCAAVLRGMNKLYNLKMTTQELKEIGVTMGADVPYCVEEGTCLSEGIGEILTPVTPMMKCHIILVKPHINISTKYVYENLKLSEVTEHPDIDGQLEALRKGDLYGLTSKMGNVLESVTQTEYPIISEIKSKLNELGALNSLMSGSGSTVFGIFEDENLARVAYDYMKKSGLGRQVYITEPFNP